MKEIQHADLSTSTRCDLRNVQTARSARSNIPSTKPVGFGPVGLKRADVELGRLEDNLDWASAGGEGFKTR